VTDHDAETPERYTCEGNHTIVARGAEGVTIFVARSTLPGRPWLRFVRKIGRPGWWVTSHKSRRLALASPSDVSMIRPHIPIRG
jgi:hypothetical protein